MKAVKAASVREVSRDLKPIHPNSFFGMKESGDLIDKFEDQFQKGQPVSQIMFDEMWTAFNNLWTSVDVYMGHPQLPSKERYDRNVKYLAALTKRQDKQYAQRIHHDYVGEALLRGVLHYQGEDSNKPNQLSQVNV